MKPVLNAGLKNQQGRSVFIPDGFKRQRTGFDRISGLAMAINPGEACYVPLGSAEVQTGSNFDLFAAPQKSEQRLSREQAAKWLKSVFTDRSILKIGHAMKLDLHFMSQIFGTETAIEPIDDIAVISYDLDSTEHGHGIDELAELFLDYKAQKLEDLLGSGKTKLALKIWTASNCSTLPLNRPT